MTLELIDIIEPAPISAWPPAWSFWPVLAIALIGLGLLLGWGWRMVRRARRRRAALTELAHLLHQGEQRGENPAAALNRLLKRVVADRHPTVWQQDTATWFEWLARQLPPEDALPLQRLRESLYARQCGLEAEELRHCVARWLRRLA